MTDKQIIIDVSDCSELCGTKCHILMSCTNTTKSDSCSEMPNCYYKQLKRKEQECEELNAQLAFSHEEIDDIKEQIKPHLKRQDDLEVYDLSWLVYDFCNQLDQLKAENDKYSLFIEKLCDYAGLECDNEEQAMRALSDLASQMNKARWIIDRYKQTLVEIKEIAKKPYSIPCGGVCVYPECKDETTENGKYCMELKLKTILQKISEVENGKM